MEQEQTSMQSRYESLPVHICTVVELLELEVDGKSDRTMQCVLGTDVEKAVVEAWKDAIVSENTHVLSCFHSKDYAIHGKEFARSVISVREKHIKDCDGTEFEAHCAVS